MKDSPMHLKSNNCLGMSFPFYVSRDRIDIYIDLHRHDFVEVEYLLSGHGYETINGIVHELRPGNLSVLFPWSCHDLRPDSDDPLTFIKVCFNMELFLEGNSPFYQLRDIAFDLKKPPFVFFDQDQQKEMSEIFLFLEQEFSSDFAFKEMMFFAKITELLVRFDRARSQNNDGKQLFPANIWDAVEYIQQNFHKDITLKDTAEKYNYKPEELNRRLKSATGLDFAQLLTDIRIRNACAMLIYHKTPISVISAQVGYKSEETFYRTFRNIKGMSPINYRKKYAGEYDLVFPSYIDAKIIFYIHRNFKNDITIADIAKQFHYNENYLSDILKSQTGQSFTEILREIRVFHAASLLLTTDDPVSKIGFDVGFSSNETFLRVFKAHYGCSPSEYRKMHGKVENM
ncbi:MAG TPA: AraC family transcriptional regulator [Clostridiales bacterium]|nr:AraC family transcriptional regulator [Clostridiales bacterium]